MDFLSAVTSTPLEPSTSTPSTTSVTKNLVQSNIIIGTSISNNNQEFLVAANTRSGANRSSLVVAQTPKSSKTPSPTLPNPDSTDRHELIGHSNLHGMTLVMLHEFTGFITSTTKTIAGHWPLLLERSDTLMMRGKLETNGFLFWNIGMIVFCVSTPDRLSRLGLLQADFNNITLSGKKADKTTIFPQQMEVSTGLDLLGLAIKKRYPNMRMTAMGSTPLALHAPTTVIAMAHAPEFQSDSIPQNSETPNLLSRKMGETTTTTDFTPEIAG